jgi:hypothetical protein
MDTKLVMVLRDDLSGGLAVNAAAVLALSLGGRLDGGALVFGPRGPVTKLTKRFPLMR